MNLNVIRTLTVKGVDNTQPAVDGLNKTAAAYDKVSQAATTTATVTETSAKRQGSVADAWRRQTLSLDEAARAQDRIAKATVVADRALQQGVISQSEYASRLDLIRTRFSSGAAANDNFGKSIGLARHELVNMSRQVQDIGVSLASGQSPLMVLVQQGAQLADIFATSQGGVKGFAAQAKESLMSILTPGRLIVLGFTAGAAAAYGLYALLKTEQPTAEKNLEEQARLIGVMKSAYDSATDAAGKFYAQSREQTVFQSITNIDRMRKNLRDLAEEMTKASTAPTSLGMPEMGIGPDPTAVVAQGRFKGFATAISDLQNTIRAGSPDLDAFNKRISELGTSDPSLREAAIRLLDISKNATEMAQKINLAEASLRLMQGTATEADRILLNLSGTINKVNMVRIREQNEIAMKALTAFSPAAKAEIAFLETRLRLQEQVNRKELTLAEQEEQANAARQLSLKSSAVARSEAMRERELAGRQSVTSAQLEIDLIGKTIGEQTRLRADLQARQQLEQEAARNRTAFDQAEFVRLQQINAELGKKAQERARADINAQIKLDRATMFLSPEDVQIAQQLKGLYGDDIPKALASSEAAAMRFNNAMKDGVGMVRDVALDLAKAALAGQHMGDALVTSLDKVASKLLDKSFQDALMALASGGDPIMLAKAGAEAAAAMIIGAFANDEKRKASAANENQPKEKPRDSDQCRQAA